MSQRILAISCAIILFHTSRTLSQSTSTTSKLPSFTTSLPSPTSRPQSNTDSQIEIFWKSNWRWFLIGVLSALVPILLWAILGPGRRWYKARRYRSAPIQWDRVGSERFQSPSMREIGGFSSFRGSGSSATSSRLALNLNAAAPGEQDIEIAAAIASPKSPSTYINRERMIRNDTTEAVIGLVQPQIHTPRPQGLMPPNQPADRNSTGSLGPPDPHVHRAHPKYNTFQRYSRQQKKRNLSMSAQQDAPAVAAQSSNSESRQESMSLLQTQIPHRKPLPNTREYVPTAANMRTSKQIFLPQPPKPTPYHIRQGSYQSDHSRSASWHNTLHRGSIQTNPYGLHTPHMPHASMGGYHPISEPMTVPPVLASSPTLDSRPRRSTSRGRLQKPQHMSLRSSSHHTHQNQPEAQRTREEPQMSFYRTPQSSRENLGRPRAYSNPSSIPNVPSLPQQPTYPKLAYPARSAMSSKIHQQRDDRVYGTEPTYSFSISAGNPPTKSVKFAALPQLSTSVPARLATRHF